MEQIKQRIISSSLYGAIATVLFVTAITIWGELHAPIKNWLAITFSHHWLGKSILSVAVFFVIAIIIFMFRRKSGEYGDSTDRLVSSLTKVVVLCTAVFLVFYLYEYFK